MNDKDNRGRLSRNERKEKETHPDMKGSATINGVEYWISGWTKENDRGKWLSLSFEQKYANRAPAGRDQRRNERQGPDIPW